MIFWSAPSLTDDEDVAALIAAAETDQVAAIERLLADGVAIDGRDAQGRTALLAATHRNSVAAAGS